MLDLHKDSNLSYLKLLYLGLIQSVFCMISISVIIFLLFLTLKNIPNDNYLIMYQVTVLHRKTEALQFLRKQNPVISIGVMCTCCIVTNIRMR